METFKDVLNSNNLKATHQRLAILNCINEFGHADVDTIFSSINKQYPSMSKATLYRNIKELISYHILEEVKLPDKKQQYEIKKIPHVHLLCQKCGKIEDVFIETKPLYETITRKSGFRIKHGFIVMDGICKACQ